MRIVMIGATGLVGSLLCDRILEAGEAELHVIGRRAAGRSGPRFREHVAPPDRWPALVSSIGAEKAVSTLGTTMRAAGSTSRGGSTRSDAFCGRFRLVRRSSNWRRWATAVSLGVSMGNLPALKRVPHHTQPM